MRRRTHAFSALVLMACALSAACAVQPDSAESGNAGGGSVWFDCRSSSDCEIVRDSSCRLVSVNRRYIDQVLDWVRTEQPGRLGERRCDATVPERDIDYYPACEAGKCSFALGDQSPSG